MLYLSFDPVISNLCFGSEKIQVRVLIQIWEAKVVGLKV